MNDYSLADITVTEICKESNTGRNTFYTYYEDKYALLQDCFREFERETKEAFEERQRTMNPEKELAKSFQNLLDVLIDLRTEYVFLNDFNDLDMMMMYYHFISESLAKFEETEAKFLADSFDLKQLNSFFALGFWGFLHGNPTLSTEQTKKNAHYLIKTLTAGKLVNNN